MNNYHKHIEKLVILKPKKIQKILLEGIKLDKKAKEIILKRYSFKNFEEAANFLIFLGQKTADLPRRTLNIISENKLKKSHRFLISLAEKLRAGTVYPDFTSKIVVPLAIRELIKLKVKKPEEKVNFLTYKEILAKKIKPLGERLLFRKEKKLFVYVIRDNKEKIEWFKDNFDILRKLNYIPSGEIKIIKGTIAFKGRVRGLVRVILGSKIKIFDKGDILVSVQSSPKLMPYLKKCGAIVTDEGGLGCHAAIISRELKKPCIVGTHQVTQILKDGDLVEVDANKGVVKILKRR